VFEIELVQPSRLAGPEPAPAEAATAASGSDGRTAGSGAGAVEPARLAWTAALAGVLDDQGAAVDPAKVVTAEDVSGVLGEPVFTAGGDVMKLLMRVNKRMGSAVSGVGDQAYLRGDSIALLRGEVVVSIRLQSRRVADRPAALSRLAAAADRRLTAAASEAPA
jgi:hypothetical protein